MRNYGMLLGIVGWIHNPSASISRWERETGDSPDAVGQLVGLLHTVSNNRVLDYNPWGGPLASICSLWHLSTIVARTHMDMETCAHTRMHKHEHTETCTHNKHTHGCVNTPTHIHSHMRTNKLLQLKLNDGASRSGPWRGKHKQTSCVWF